MQKVVNPDEGLIQADANDSLGFEPTEEAIKAAETDESSESDEDLEEIDAPPEILQLNSFLCCF